jgi:drug/metabolite transporter (DMT)-like permease
MLCVALSLAGLALLSLHGAQVRAGDLLVLAGAIGFAGHIVTVDVLVARHDPLLLGLAQLAGAAAIQILLGAPDGAQLHTSASLWYVYLLTGVLGSGVAFVVQVVGQSAVTPARASVLLAGEALCSALVSAVWLGERLSAREWAGVATMAAAIAISETHAWRHGGQTHLDPATSA